MAKTVYVAMSGGVDSSVSALLLKEQGFDVVGVYMKNWAKDIAGFNCPWETDLTDADAVAAQIGIKLKVYDFQKQYKQKVVDYMLATYKAGETPNPDIMCNQEIKFKLFTDTAFEDGADLVATGHYAKIKDGGLYMAKDKTKDQSYFLCRVNPLVLKRVLFPLADLTKKQVRQIAKKAGLITASKKDSVGICFVGEVGVKDFLSQYVKPKSGEIINQDRQVIGQHDGAIFYTIGQRHGLGVGGGLPYYVVGKDMKKNIVYVTTKLDDGRLWSNQLTLTNLHWLDKKPLKEFKIRARYQSALVGGEFESLTGSRAVVKLTKPLKAVGVGQSAVIYSKDQVVLSGIISAN